MPWELDTILGPEMTQLGLRRLDPLRHIGKELRGGPTSDFAKVAVLESGLYMRNQLLRDTDWASMAHSLEVRVPLVDAVLLRAMAAVLGRGTAVSKRLLATAPRLPLPERIIKRPKTGFTTPIQTWLQRDSRIQHWRKVPSVAVKTCPWARRWACEVAEVAAAIAAQGQTPMATSSLRVLALVTDAFGGHGGIAQYNRDLIRSLATCDGISDVVVLPRIAEETSDTPAKVQQLRPQRGRLAYSLSALRIALGKHIDVVFCGHLLMAPLGAALAKLLGVPLWVQIHGIEAWHGLSRVHRWAIETASVVTSVSRYTRHRLLQWVRIDPTRVKVLPNTVDPRFRPARKLARLLDRHAASGKKVLLTVSRLASSERYKGHDRVIRALPRVLAQHPEAVYLVVGDGDDRSRLEMIAAETGVREQVHFTGLVGAEDLPTITAWRMCS